MDLWQLIAGVLVGSATTGFGWWLSERSARARQWSADKRTTYGAFLAAARQLEHTRGAFTAIVRNRIVGPELTETDFSRIDRAAAALFDLTALSAQLWLVAPIEVIRAADEVISAGTDLFQAAPGDDAAGDKWEVAKRAFEAAARKDLRIPF